MVAKGHSVNCHTKDLGGRVDGEGGAKEQDQAEGPVFIHVQGVNVQGEIGECDFHTVVCFLNKSNMNLIAN